MKEKPAAGQKSHRQHGSQKCLDDVQHQVIARSGSGHLMIQESTARYAFFQRFSHQERNLLVPFAVNRPTARRQTHTYLYQEYNLMAPRLWRQSTFHPQAAHCWGLGVETRERGLVGMYCGFSCLGETIIVETSWSHVGERLGKSVLPPSPLVPSRERLRHGTCGI